MQAQDVQDDLKNVLFTKEEINAKVAELAARIDEDYEGKDVLLVGVLKGAIMVMADLSARSRGITRWTGWRFLRTDPARNPRVWFVSSKTLIPI